MDDLADAASQFAKLKQKLGNNKLADAARKQIQQQLDDLLNGSRGQGHQGIKDHIKVVSQYWGQTGKKRIKEDLLNVPKEIQKLIDYYCK